MDEQFFDELARGLDEGTISRRRALRLFGTAALGAALVPVMPKQAEALTRKERRRCRRRGGTPLEKGKCHCALTSCGGPTFTCNGDVNCFCAKTAENTGFCASRFGTCSPCTSSGDCPRGNRCVVNTCCGGPACQPACPTQ